MGKNKLVIGCYHVCDCEHRGDIENSVSYLRRLGCEILSSYWDGIDCGESWVRFSIPSTRFVEIYKKLLGSLVEYDSDINDYIISDSSSVSYSRYSKLELRKLCDTMRSDLSFGFEERLPLWLMFSLSGGCKIDDVISKVLSYFPHSVEVKGYSTQLVDGNEYCDVLLESSYKNLLSSVMRDGIGDYCLGHYGWFGSSGIYGECRCVHNVLNTGLLWGYDYLQRVVKCIQLGLPLEYRNSDSYYYPKDLVLSSSEYMDSDRTFKSVVEHCGKVYTIKDPRQWNWGDSVYSVVLDSEKKGLSHDTDVLI